MDLSALVDQRGTVNKYNISVYRTVKLTAAISIYKHHITFDRVPIGPVCRTIVKLVSGIRTFFTLMHGCVGLGVQSGQVMVLRLVFRHWTGTAIACWKHTPHDRGQLNPDNAEIFLYKLWGPKGFFQFKIIINVLVTCCAFPFIWIPMLWV